MTSNDAHPRFDFRDAARRVMIEEGFNPDFDRAIEQQLASLDEHREDVSSSVRDLRALPWSSIDNHESRDLDQIEAIELLDGSGAQPGRVRIMVGIADVDAYVEKGDAIDRHAAANTTSVYAGSVMFPMLPEALSTDATSLLEGKDRLAIVTEFVVDGAGRVSDESVYRAWVTNHAKLAYEDVAAWLDGKAPPPPPLASSSIMQEQVRVQDQVAKRLRAVRIANGALEFDTTEARPITRGSDVVDLRVLEHSRARDLIEALMVAANGVTARWLEKTGRAGLARVVRTPKRWDRIVALAATYGVTLPAEADPKALAAFLAARRAADPERMPDLSLSIIKLLGPGEYALDKPGESQGHFGLAVPDYAHSTAPNRRFADLVTQRLVKAALAKEPSPYSDAELSEIAARCTDREHAAQKVERTTRKIAAALFLRNRIGETFDAIVTGATPKGVFARLLTPPAEGRVVSNEAGLDVGDRVRVKLVATEPSRGFIDFVRV